MKGNNYDNLVNDNRAFEYFKKIRNHLHQCFPEEVVKQCLTKLNKKTSKEYMAKAFRQSPPWFHFLIIKWAVKYGEYLSPDRKHLSDNDNWWLFDTMHEYYSFPKNLNDHRAMSLYFRAITYQQYWLMENYPINRLGRQKKLFSDLKDDHYFKTTFKKETGLPIEDFLELYCGLVSLFVTLGGPQLPEEWFSTAEYSYPEETAEKFLSVISLSFSGLKTYLESKPKLSPSVEFFEQTPLRSYPLLKMGDTYYCYLYDMLSARIEHVIYELLYYKDREKFTCEFGSIFRKYIGDELNYASLNYHEAGGININSGGPENKTCFVITEENANIFISLPDAELDSDNLDGHPAKNITENFYKSISDCVDEYFSTVSNLVETNSPDVIDKPCYLFIITYRDLYLGNGKYFFDEVARTRYDDFRDKYPGCFFLESKNIYFLSIDDFDLTVELAKSKGKSFSEILQYATLKDISYSSRKFLFRQHIKEIDNKIVNAGYLLEDFKVISKGWIEKIHTEGK